ncbi:hypothetical protein F4820DRAFT_403234 [Hypoxylon rubiginosum]|uniref:Uncharacterized protein n=1 Tax=Hypoxylon rubiginosum TaxID=110542 RepID=A0ACB9ZG87_9PEZI|nr:hypothetical protein F4820DRAFT_403234 [Hypoxylon rubiginosum]
MIVHSKCKTRLPSWLQLFFLSPKLQALLSVSTPLPSASTLSILLSHSCTRIFPHCYSRTVCSMASRESGNGSADEDYHLLRH